MFARRRSGPQNLKWFARRQRGLSLLEVILAIAILGGALVVINELLRLGYRSAAEARDRSEAQILCDAKMAELAAGVMPLDSVDGVPIPENQDWLYSVEVQPSAQVGLLGVRVTVQQSPAAAAQPIGFSVVRLLPDPDYEPPTAAAEEGLFP